MYMGRFAPPFGSKKQKKKHRLKRKGKANEVRKD